MNLISTVIMVLIVYGYFNSASYPRAFSINDDSSRETRLLMGSNDHTKTNRAVGY